MERTTVSSAELRERGEAVRFRRDVEDVGVRRAFADVAFRCDVEDVGLADVTEVTALAALSFTRGTRDLDARSGRRRHTELLFQARKLLGEPGSDGHLRPLHEAFDTTFVVFERVHLALAVDELLGLAPARPQPTVAS